MNLFPNMDYNSMRIVRHATGLTLAASIAFSHAWFLSFLTPVLVGMLVGSPKGKITLKMGVGFVATISAACYASSMFLVPLINLPIVYLIVSGVVLFNIYYASLGKISPFFLLWLLISIMMLPMIAMLSDKAASFIAESLIFGASVAVAVAWIIDLFLPLPEPPADQLATKQAAEKPDLSPEDKYKSAMASFVCVYPAMACFFIFQWSGYLLVLIFISLLSMNPATATKGGVGMIIGNMLGGVIVIVYYQLLVAVPSLAFMIISLFTLSMWLAGQLYSGKKFSPFYGMALTTVVLITGMTTTSNGEEGATAKILSRVFQVMLAVGYITMFYFVRDWFKKHPLFRRETVGECAADSA